MLVMLLATTEKSGAGTEIEALLLEEATADTTENSGFGTEVDGVVVIVGVPNFEIGVVDRMLVLEMDVVF